LDQTVPVHEDPALQIRLLGLDGFEETSILGVGHRVQGQVVGRQVDRKGFVVALVAPLAPSQEDALRDQQQQGSILRILQQGSTCPEGGALQWLLGPVFGPEAGQG
jgi:hypothetical protein